MIDTIESFAKWASASMNPDLQSYAKSCQGIVSDVRAKFLQPTYTWGEVPKEQLEKAVKDLKNKSLLVKRDDVAIWLICQSHRSARNVRCVLNSTNVEFLVHTLSSERMRRRQLQKMRPGTKPILIRGHQTEALTPFVVVWIVSASTRLLSSYVSICTTIVDRIKAQRLSLDLGNWLVQLL